VRRGPARQLPQRQTEHRLRRRLVHFLDAAVDLGWAAYQTAQRLQLCPRTLRHWRLQTRRPDALTHLPAILGRPSQRSPRQLRNQVLATLDEFGPGLGVPSLRAMFPTMARAELADLVNRYRRLWRLRHQQALHVLSWQQPGAVWAMDFTETPFLIEGGPGENHERYLLAVRDLASGQQLLWQPVAAINTDETLAALGALFTRHGAPLVLKTDNGSPFCAEATLDFLHRAGVESLFSPPRAPRYNGAIEAGIGSLKTRTDRHASHHGHPGAWTLDDLAAAQAEANTQARPHGEHGPSPHDAWSARRPITPEERQLFQASVAQERLTLLAQEGPPDNTQAQRTLDRHAIRRALVEHGLLLFSRRRLPLPFARAKAAKIS
jgi:transposase InsO family protein